MPAWLFSARSFRPSSSASAPPAVPFTLYTPQVNASYVLDVFGGQRRTVEDLAAQMDYQGYTAQATYITLLGNVINAAVAQAAYQAQIDATEQIINIVKEQLKLTETQSTAGTVPFASVVSLETQLATTEASLPPLQQNLSKTKRPPGCFGGAHPRENGLRPGCPSQTSPLPVNCRSPSPRNWCAAGPTSSLPRPSCTAPAPRSA